ncbi:10456_t:CDS:1, partial [Funneliformis caledonium]
MSFQVVNSLGAQPTTYTETKEGTSELGQQQNMNNNSEETFSDNPTELLEFSQPSAPISSTDSSTVSSSSTLDYNY